MRFVLLARRAARLFLLARAAARFDVLLARAAARFAALLVFWLGCGLQSVELATPEGEIILLDAVPEDAIRQLERAEGLRPEPRLTLLYPDDDCAIPENLGPVEFLFGDDKKPMMDPMMKEPKSKYAVLSLRIASAHSALHLYTTQGRASVPSARWHALLREGGELTITLRALEGNDHVLESAPIRVQVLAPLRDTEIAYFSDTRGTALSSTLEGALGAPPAHYPTMDPWRSISADGTRLASANAGVLSAFNAVNPLALLWSEALYVEQPDWSPDGSTLVFVARALPPPMMMPPMMMMMPMPMPAEPADGARTSLRVARVDASGIAMPTLLFDALEPDEQMRSPVYAPDGAFIAFERLKARDKLGKLWWLRADGSELGELAIDGAWPTWLASEASDQLWLVFSQARAPGVDKLPGEGMQLWAAALRRDSASRLTPVGQPFWLLGQTTDDRNRRALVNKP
jgi:hypothetical protein